MFYFCSLLVLKMFYIGVKGDLNEKYCTFSKYRKKSNSRHYQLINYRNITCFIWASHFLFLGWKLFLGLQLKRLVLEEQSHAGMELFEPA